MATRLASPAAVRDSYKLATVIVYKTTNPNNETGAWAVWERVR